MNIAVTGGTGFLGRYIVLQLLAGGHSCRCWYRQGSDRGGFGPFEDRIDWIEGELGNQAAANELLRGCSAIVHAGLYHPGGNFRVGDGDVVEFIERNVVGTLQLIETARTLDVGRFIYISSCAVHDRILSDRPLDETHPTWASNHYGAHKAAVEQFVRSYGWGQNYPICALRPTGIYGVRRPLEDSKWFVLIASVVRGETVTCNRGGKEVHAADVARSVEILLTAEGVAGECFNCYDRYVSDYEVAHIARELSGSSSKIDGQATSPKNQIATDSIQLLGMKFGGEQLLRETIEQIVTAVQNGGV